MMNASPDPLEQHLDRIDAKFDAVVRELRRQIWSLGLFSLALVGAATIAVRL